MNQYEPEGVDGLTARASLSAPSLLSAPAIAIVFAIVSAVQNHFVDLDAESDMPEMQSNLDANGTC
ncbi:MAG TPA: hypothetical protein VKB50_18965 [Vicinamibacterales bacterium]|nr:hypothetical protein [Vicinamibacterales bacterium]